MARLVPTPGWRSPGPFWRAEQKQGQEGQALALLGHGNPTRLCFLKELLLFNFKKRKNQYHTSVEPKDVNVLLCSLILCARAYVCARVCAHVCARVDVCACVRACVTLGSMTLWIRFLKSGLWRYNGRAVKATLF